MNDHWWAGLLGVATVAAVRVLDWVLPRNYHFKQAEKYGVKETDDDE